MQNRMRNVWSMILVAVMLLSFLPGGMLAERAQAAGVSYEGGHTWAFDQTVTLGNTKGLVSGNAAGTIKVMNHEGNGNALTPDRAIGNGVLTTEVVKNWGGTVGHGVFYQLPAALEAGRIYQLSLNLYGGNDAAAMNGLTVSFGDYTATLTGSGGSIQQWQSSGIEGLHNADAKLTHSISGNLPTAAGNTVVIEFVATEAMASGGWMLISFPLALNGSYKLGSVTLKAFNYEGGYTWKFDKTVDAFGTATEFKTVYYGNTTNTVGIVNHEGYGSAWGGNTSRSLGGGLLTSVMTASWGEEGHGVYYKLPKALEIGKTYRVSMNLYAAAEGTPVTNDNSSSITVSFNSEVKTTQEWRIKEMEAYHNGAAQFSVPAPAGLSTDSGNVVSFEFVATRKLVDAGGWMLITFPMEDGKTYILGNTTMSTVHCNLDDGYTWQFDKTVDAFTTDNAYKTLYYGNEAETVSIISSENYAANGTRSLGSGVLTTLITTDAEWARGSNGVYYRLPAGLVAGKEYVVKLNLYASEADTVLANSKSEGIKLSFTNAPGEDGNNKWTAEQIDKLHNADTLRTYATPGSLSTDANNEVTITFFATEAMAENDGWMLISFPLQVNKAVNLGSVTLQTRQYNYDEGYTWKFDKTVEAFGKTEEFKTLYYGNVDNTIGIINHEGYGSAWGGNTSRSLGGGLLTSVMTTGWTGAGEEGHGVYYKLPKALTVGNAYQVSMTLYGAAENTPLSNDKSSSITVSFNSEVNTTQEWQIDKMEAYHASNKITVRTPASLSTQSGDVVSFAFVATREMVEAGPWMLITFPMEDGMTYVLGDTTIHTIDNYQTGYTWQFDKTVEAFGKTDEFKKLYYGNEAETVSIISSENYAANGTRSLGGGLLTTMITKDADWARGASGVYYKLPLDLVVGREYVVKMNLYASAEGTALVNNKSKLIKLSFTNEPTGDNLWTAEQIEGIHNANTLMTHTAANYLSPDSANVVAVSFVATQAMAENDGWMLISFPLPTNAQVHLGQTTLCEKQNADNHFLNGDFTEGLTGWMTNYDSSFVSVQDSVLTVSDTVPTSDVKLYQDMYLERGLYTLSFDVYGAPTSWRPVYFMGTGLDNSSITGAQLQVAQEAGKTENAWWTVTRDVVIAESGIYHFQMNLNQVSSSGTSVAPAMQYRNFELKKLDSVEIVWKDGDTVLETDMILSGSVPEYNGPWPTRETGCYHFIGWDQEVTAATADTTYTAQYMHLADKHTWGETKVTEPTCLAAGEITDTCSVCGYTRTETILPTGEHSWDAGVVTTEAAPGVDGVMTYTCTVCEATYTEIIEALTVAKIGEEEYTTLQAAVDAAGETDVVVLVADTTGEATVPAGKKLNLDLNGYDVNKLTVEEGGMLYGMDSATDDYDCEDGYGKIAVLEGSYAPAHRTEASGYGKRYVAFSENDGVSFHRFYVGITHVALRPGKGGAGYSMTIAGDSRVQALLQAEDAFGYTVSVTLDGEEKTCTYSGGKADFAGGVKKIDALTVDGILTVGGEKNAENARQTITATAFLRFAGMDEITVSAEGHTFRKIVEATDAGLVDRELTGEQKDALIYLYTKLGVGALGWELPNIAALTEAQLANEG